MNLLHSTFRQLIIMGCVGTALLLCLTVFLCWKRNRRLEYKYSRLARQRSTPSGSGCGGGDDASSGHNKDNANECETEMAAAESCALDDDEEEEDEVSVTVPMKSFGLVNKIRSMTAYKVLPLVFTTFPSNWTQFIWLTQFFRANPAAHSRRSN